MEGAEIALGVMKLGIQGGPNIPFKEQRACAQWWLETAGIGLAAQRVSGQGLEELLDKPITELTYAELVKVSRGLKEQLAQLNAIPVMPECVD